MNYRKGREGKGREGKGKRILYGNRMWVIIRKMTAISTTIFYTKARAASYCQLHPVDENAGQQFHQSA